MRVEYRQYCAFVGQSECTYFYVLMKPEVISHHHDLCTVVGFVNMAQLKEINCEKLLITFANNIPLQMFDRVLTMPLLCMLLVDPASSSLGLL